MTTKYVVISDCTPHVEVTKNLQITFSIDFYDCVVNAIEFRKDPSRPGVYYFESDSVPTQVLMAMWNMFGTKALVAQVVV